MPFIGREGTKWMVLYHTEYDELVLLWKFQRRSVRIFLKNIEVELLSKKIEKITSEITGENKREEFEP